MVDIYYTLYKECGIVSYHYCKYSLKNEIICHLTKSPGSNHITVSGSKLPTNPHTSTALFIFILQDICGTRALLCLCPI